MTIELAHAITYIKDQESHMTSTKGIPAQVAQNKVQEDEKSLKSLRSLGSFITLGAWSGVLVGLFLIWSMIAYKWGIFAWISIIVSFATAGALFWCDRLLQQKRQLALVVYTYVMLFGWSAVLLMRLVSSRSLFGVTDLLGLIVPAMVLFEMHRLRRKSILV
jgi:hypothetical protein